MNTAQTFRPLNLGSPVTYGSLIISPDPVLAGMLREMLEQNSCHARWVRGYDEAVEVLSSSSTQHAFVDLRPSSLCQSPQRLLS